MKLREMSEIVNKFKEKGRSVGLDIDDFRELKSLMKYIGKYNDEKWNNLYLEIDSIVKEMYSSGIANTFSKKNSNYIENNSYLLPLVIANNEYPKIKLYNNNSYMFLCQFHSETSPSMGVTDFLNKLHCYGCGFSANSISYLMQYEKISYKQAIQLLAQIYLFDIKNYDYQLEPLVKKYQTAILSNQYFELLKFGEKRLRERYGEDFNNISIKKIYDDRHSMIERIRNREYDPNFIYDEPKKRIYICK